MQQAYTLAMHWSRHSSKTQGKSLLSSCNTGRHRVERFQTTCAKISLVAVPMAPVLLYANSSRGICLLLACRGVGKRHDHQKLGKSPHCCRFGSAGASQQRLSRERGDKCLGSNHQSPSTEDLRMRAKKESGRSAVGPAGGTSVQE